MRAGPRSWVDPELVQASGPIISSHPNPNRSPQPAEGPSEAGTVVGSVSANVKPVAGPPLRDRAALPSRGSRQDGTDLDGLAGSDVTGALRPDAAKPAALSFSAARTPLLPETVAPAGSGDPAKTIRLRPARVDRPEEAKLEDADGRSSPSAGRAVPAAAPEVRVFVHYSAWDAASERNAERLAATLAARGFTFVELRAVDVAVRRNSVRLFHDSDRAVASPLRLAVAQHLRESGSVSGLAVQDFRDYERPPRPGTVEVWLAS